MPDDAEPPSAWWRSYFGPVIVTPRRRRFNAVLRGVWVVATVAALVSGQVDLVWLPLIGIATSSVLLFRDRAGRRRRALGSGPPAD
jgi:hypothetical protein